jgi:hypothetical protein
MKPKNWLSKKIIPSVNHGFWTDNQDSWIDNQDFWSGCNLPQALTLAETRKPSAGTAIGRNGQNDNKVS